jgi:NAD(P)-dependent dehydrogenase (short-subunit alcohol dehydrogenase family)
VAEPRRFAGKVAFVTGGAYGIGRAYGRALAAEGAAVAIADVDDERIAGTVAQFERDGWPVFGVNCDVANDQEVDAAVAAACDRFGGIDILINNAGAAYAEYARPRIVDLSRELWRRAVDVNMTGIVNCTRAVHPSMRERGGGVIVNQLSGSAYFHESGAYTVTKAGGRALVPVLARELASDGIRVYGIAPGLVDSETAMSRYSGDELDAMIDRQPIKRLGRMSDLAQALLFFCSDDASWITGETLIVGGGFPLRF